MQLQIFYKFMKIHSLVINVCFHFTVNVSVAIEKRTIVAGFNLFNM